MNANSSNSNLSDHRLPVPGTVYSIPADTHADLDLQDDKEQIFYRRGSQRNFYTYYRKRR